MDLVEPLATFVSDLTFESIPEDVVAFSVEHIVDAIGVMIAGYGAEAVQVLADEVIRWGGAPDARIVGRGDRVPTHHAALVNGAMARALDFDDVHEGALNHPTVGILPALLAAADTCGRVTGRDLITAFVAGVETSVRLGLAPNVGSQVSGISHTYQPGVFGAAVAVAKLRGYTREQILDTFGHASNSVSGTQQCVVEASLSVRLEQGHCAMSSVLAADFGARFRSLRDVFDGMYGYFPVFHHQGYRRDVVLDGLGERYEYTGTSIKPYPNGRATHAALDAGRRLRAALNGSAIESIDHIDVGVSSISARLTAPPGRVGRFATPRERMFSQAWSFALGFVRAGADLGDFVIEPPDREHLEHAAGLVRVIATDDESGPARRVGGATATAHTAGGPAATVAVAEAEGSPARPLTTEQVDAKFLACCRWSGMEEGVAAGLLADLRSLTTATDVGVILAALDSLDAGDWAPR